MPATTLTSARPTTWREASTRTPAISSARAKIAAVAAAALLALTFRVGALATYGFSEDELNKVAAIEDYRGGSFTTNAEHPMLMKLAMWGSVGLVGQWNRFAPRDQAVPLETAIRLPNAIAGALTTLVVFGVADLLFGGLVA